MLDDALAKTINSMYSLPKGVVQPDDWFWGYYKNAGDFEEIFMNRLEANLKKIVSKVIGDFKPKSYMCCIQQNPIETTIVTLAAASFAYNGEIKSIKKSFGREFTLYENTCGKVILTPALIPGMN